MLIAKDQFIGLENVVHLATGGESPALKSHQAAVAQFFTDKAHGEKSRALQEVVMERCKEKAAALLNATTEEITFLSSSSEGINLLAHAIDWREGDNVVVADVEFPSDVLPWTRFEHLGVEIRIVPHREDWRIHLADIREKIDERTRVVAISQVSYFTGQRQLVEQLSQIVRASNAIFLLDVTHAAGVVPVDVSLADIAVSSCYKWLLGVHGTAVFYWNKERLPNLEPPFVGWNTGVTIPAWDAPTEFTLRSTADRFLPGNPSFISLYVLDNALSMLLEIGIDKIEKHALSLSGQVLEGVHQLGYELMTPTDPNQRAGNVCFLVEDIHGTVERLASRGIQIWGGYGGVGRIRVSTHLYNTAEDVELFLRALSRGVGSDW